MKKLIERPKRGLAKSRVQAVVPGSAATVPTAIDEAALLGDLRTLVQSARQRIATAAYSTQTLLCWHMGRRLDSEHLQGGRAAYGKQILVTVSRELTADYGRGFSYAKIARMIQFAQAFPDEAIVVTLCATCAFATSTQRATGCASAWSRARAGTTATRCSMRGCWRSCASIG